jgi:hypothetical protein
VHRYVSISNHPIRTDRSEGLDLPAISHRGPCSYLYLRFPHMFVVSGSVRFEFNRFDLYQFVS